MRSNTQSEIKWPDAVDQEALDLFRENKYTWRYFSEKRKERNDFLSRRSFVDPLRAFHDPELLPKSFLRASKSFVERTATEALKDKRWETITECSSLPGISFLFAALDLMKRSKIAIPYTHLSYNNDDHNNIITHMLLYSYPLKDECDSLLNKNLIKELKNYDNHSLIAAGICSLRFSILIGNALGLDIFSKWIKFIHIINGYRAISQRNLYERGREESFFDRKNMKNSLIPYNIDIEKNIKMPKAIFNEWNKSSLKFSTIPDLIRYTLPKSDHNFLDIYDENLSPKLRHNSYKINNHKNILSLWTQKNHNRATFNLQTMQSQLMFPTQIITKQSALQFYSPEGSLWIDREKNLWLSTKKSFLALQSKILPEKLRYASLCDLINHPNLHLAQERWRNSINRMYPLFSPLFKNPLYNWYNEGDGEFSSKRQILQNVWIKHIQNIGFKNISHDTWEWYDFRISRHIKIKSLNTANDLYGYYEIKAQNFNQKHYYWEDIPDLHPYWFKEVMMHLSEGIIPEHESPEDEERIHTWKETILRIYTEIGTKFQYETSKNILKITNNKREATIDLLNLHIHTTPSIKNFPNMDPRIPQWSPAKYIYHTINSLFMET